MKRSFALIAVLFLLLRPLCDVRAAGSAHGEPGVQTHATANYHADGAATCCAAFHDGSLVNLGEPAAARSAGEGKLAFATPGLIAVHYASAPRADARVRLGTFFTPSSFYARSARIRR
jgi:hypothetical protein